MEVIALDSFSTYILQFLLRSIVMASAARSAVGSYRTLLRTISHVFTGDAKALQTGRLSARQGFRANAAVHDPDAIAKLVDEARDATEFLREHIVQAKINNEGNYALKVHGDFREEAKMTLQTPAEASSKTKEGCCGGGC